MLEMKGSCIEKSTVTLLCRVTSFLYLSCARVRLTLNSQCADHRAISSRAISL